MIVIVSYMYGRRIKMRDIYDKYEEFKNDDLKGFKDKRSSYLPWYNDKSDYNTNAKSYYDYLGRMNYFYEIVQELINYLLDRDKYTKDYYINIKDIPGKDISAIGDGKTDNTKIFRDFKKGFMYYVPEGTFFTTEMPDGLFFGYGKILVNDEEIILDKTPGQMVNVDYRKGQDERYYNWIQGQNSGRKMNRESYANTGAGYSVMKETVDGRRLTGMGKGALSQSKSGYSEEAFGADALGQGKFGKRNSAFGANALKWGGVTNAIDTLHDFWLDKGKNNFIRSYFEPRYPNVWDLIGTEDEPNDGLYPKENDDYVNNVGVGRNALLHLMRGVQNVAVGYNAQAHTIRGDDNTAVGNRALRDNLEGNRNTAYGSMAETNNITGQDNVGIGGNALQQTYHASNNTALGYGAMHFFKDDKNSDPKDGYGKRNTAIGTQSMQDGKNSSYSVMVGSYAGRYVEGDHNVGVGSESSVNITKGELNVGVGSNTLREIEEGNNNTAIGYTSGPTGDYSYTTSLGSNAHPQGNHQVQVGGADDTVYAHKSLQVRSDKRLKKEVKDTIMGLDYITKLRPVDFKYNNSNSNRFHHGLIAQEVEEIPDYAFGGVDNPKYTGGDDVYNLSYEEFIAPLIKSVQELTQRVELLEKENQELKKG